MHNILCFSHQNCSVKFSEIQRTLQAIRSSTIPPTPKTADDINKAYVNSAIFDEFGKSLHTEPKDFFKTAYECKSFSYCIFASETNIGYITENIAVQNRRYLMDATFKIVPDCSFNQLLIVYVEYLDKVIYHTIPYNLYLNTEPFVFTFIWYTLLCIWHAVKPTIPFRIFHIFMADKCILHTQYVFIYE